MDIKKYIERINYAGPVDPTFEVLSELQIMHLLHVPFENLDIHNNTKIDLTNLFDKIVVRKRGGFCYELNGLFYGLLKELGFKVKMVSARVYNDKKNYGAEFDHIALIVKIEDDTYVVDVGFGEFSSYPIKIALDKETIDPRGIFRIEIFNESYKVIKKKNTNGAFIPEYIFSEKERQLEDFYGMCNYHQTSRESHFTQNRICSLPTKNGRITLTGDTVKITENGKVKETQLSNGGQIRRALWNYFGIKL
ncbi:MAG: arylamine N-acetyltransferase [Ferruginibacter sp.]